MKFLKYVPVILLLILYNDSFTQNKLLTIDDIVTAGRTTLAPRRLLQLQWLPGEKSYVYIDKAGNTLTLFRGHTGSDKTENVLTLDEFNNALKMLNVSPVNRFPLLKWLEAGKFRFLINNSIYTFELATKTATRIDDLDNDALNIEVERNHNYAAYTKLNNLFLSLNSGNVKQITRDTITEIVNGQSVHRNEFGIEKGIFWSPNSNMLAFYRMDQTMVTDYPLVDITERPANLVKIKYPMAGMASHQVTIGIYNVKTEKTTWLKTGEPKDQYLTNVTWSPDEKYIFVAHLNRDQNLMRLIKYDAASGDMVKTLFEEKSDKYVEPLNGPIFLNNSNNGFLWQSRRDGWNHFYLYDTAGNLLKQLKKGEWEVTSFEGFDKNAGRIFFMATKEDVLQRHLYSLNLSSGEMKKLTSAEGTHLCQLENDGDFFIDTYSNLNVPYIASVNDAKGNINKTLLKSDNPIKEYAIGQTKIFPIPGNGGYKLFSRVIFPVDFDSAKKYPVLVYVYGGPHSQLVTNEWLGGANLWLNYMAEQGYIVFTLDNRGTSNRGLEFEQTTFRHLGTHEIEDQLSGIEYLKNQPYVDQNRIGVFGWSYGGFMATSLMTRAADVFKVGVAGGPVIDWSYYEIMYGERYMDTPQQNPEGYRESSLLNYVDKLKGKLLLIHGTMDPTVVWQNSLMFVKKAVSLDIPLDYFPYPGHEHGVTGTDNIHLYKKITAYFKNNL
ncbi:MAG: S9 family peptidase [Ignavibacteriales bacterium]